MHNVPTHSLTLIGEVHQIGNVHVCLAGSKVQHDESSPLICAGYQVSAAAAPACHCRCPGCAAVCVIAGHLSSLPSTSR